MLFNNLTIFYVLELIFNHQDYRVTYVYTTNITNGFSSQISKLAWNHMVPVTLINCTKTRERYNRCEEPILNIFIINDLSDANIIAHVKNVVLPDDVTVIWFTSPNSDMEHLNFQPWMKLGFKVLILWKRFLMSLNKFNINQINEIPIEPYDSTATQRFIEDYLSDKEIARGANMMVFMQHIPPKSLVAPKFRSDNYTFNGPDGTIADALFKGLQVNPTYVTNIEILFPQFRKWKLNPVQASRLRFYEFHKQATTSNIISDFNATTNSSIDFLMTGQLVEPHVIDHVRTDDLYPHDKEYLSVLVPQQLQVHNFLRKIVHHGDVQSIGIVLLLFVLVRITMQRASWKDWASIAFNTLQLFLVQGKIVNRNAIEEAWANILRGFSLFAIITISAILYNSLINVQPKEIDTVADLIASNLTIIVPESLKSHFMSLNSTTYFKLRERLVWQSDEAYGDAVFGEIINAAYVCYESKVQFVLNMNNLFAAGGTVGRIMKEKLHCRLSSYRIKKSLPFKRIANNILRRCLENGLYDKAHVWSKNLNDVLFKNFNVDPIRDEIVLKLEIILNVFILYLAGMLVSFVVFIIEISIIFNERRKPMKIQITEV